MDKGCIMEKEMKREGKNCVIFFSVFMGWVSRFYFCNNSFFITGNAPLILKILNNKTHVILFCTRKMLFLSYLQFYY